MRLIKKEKIFGRYWITHSEYFKISESDSRRIPIICFRRGVNDWNERIFIRERVEECSWDVENIISTEFYWKVIETNDREHNIDNHNILDELYEKYLLSLKRKQKLNRILDGEV